VTYVVVLAGGLSFERDVSLQSGRRVTDALRRAGVDTVQRDTDSELVPELLRNPPDAVFVALHGEAGEDGSLRDVLDLVGVPYVGSGSTACRLAWDKPSAKAALRAAGLTTPDWMALPKTTFRDLGAPVVLERIVARFGLPLMVKPTRGGSALGARAVQKPDELPAAMMGCFSYSDVALVEPFVEGTEVAVSVVADRGGPVALPAVEVVAAGGVYDYEHRYTAGTTTWHAPARLDPEIAENVGKTAVAAHEALGLRDLSRTDAIVTPDGDVVILEVNVAPGMTDTSLLPLAAQAAGRDLGELCASLVQTAAARR
jgi:D-alanine-D-alanine ligase